MDHHGKDTISTKEVIVDLQCSPLSNSQDRGHHLQAHLECLQHRLKTIQSFGRALPTQPHTDNFPGPPGSPPIRLPTKQYPQAAEPRRTDVAGIMDLPPLQEIDYDEFDADCESDDASDFGVAESKAPISLKQMEFSLKQFAKRMMQSSFSTFHKCKKVLVARLLKKKHRSIILGQNHLKLLRDGPLHRKTAGAVLLETFEASLPLEIFDYAESIR
jgi:hypothetical protein